MEKVKNCHNVSTAIEGTGQSAGGVIGQNGGVIENCTNTGNILGQANDVGGVVGVM